MTNKFLRILFFWVLISLSFVAAGTFLIIDASGYKINWSAKQLVKTGLFLLETKPSEVTVYMDGQIVAQKTPLKIDRMLPGQYSFEVHRPKYKTWSKLVTIEAGYVTSLPSVVLFLENPIIEPGTEADMEIIKNRIADSDLYANGSEIYYVEDGSAHLATRLTETVKQVAWYPDKMHIAYQAGRTIYISENKGESVNQILTLESDEPVSMTFADNGTRLLVLQNDKLISATVR
jgi:hypothetical protein